MSHALCPLTPPHPGRWVGQASLSHLTGEGSEAERRLTARPRSPGELVAKPGPQRGPGPQACWARKLGCRRLPQNTSRLQLKVPQDALQDGVGTARHLPRDLGHLRGPVPDLVAVAAPATHGRWLREQHLTLETAVSLAGAGEPGAQARGSEGPRAGVEPLPAPGRGGGCGRPVAPGAA